MRLYATCFFIPKTAHVGRSCWFVAVAAGRSSLCHDNNCCRGTAPPIRFCTRPSIHILSRREASASARKAWSSWASFRRRGWRLLRLRGVACVWARWGVLGEGKARGDLRRSAGLGNWSIYSYIGREVGVRRWAGRQAWAKAGFVLRAMGSAAWASDVLLGAGVKKKI